MTMRLSVIESSSLFAAALQAAGLPYGTIPAAARMVQWAEIQHGRGIAPLARRRDELARSDPAALRIESDGATATMIDAGGQSSLLAGPPALDLATEKARTTGTGLAAVRDARHLDWLGQLAEQGAARGLVCLLTWCGGDGDGGTVVCLPGDGAALRVELAQTSAAHDPLMAGEMGAGGADLLRAALTPGPARTDGFAFACLAPGDDGLAALEVAARAADAEARLYEAAEVVARGRRAVAEGIEVDSRIWHDLTRQAFGILVPSSEHSLMAAGADG